MIHHTSWSNHHTVAKAFLPQLSVLGMDDGTEDDDDDEEEEEAELPTLPSTRHVKRTKASLKQQQKQQTTAKKLTTSQQSGRRLSGKRVQGGVFPPCSLFFCVFLLPAETGMPSPTAQS